MSASHKVLRSSTIIQDGLYVDRDADRQLNAIIEEMGRPGYVLVARQMGKTNLLLRMKRRREALREIVLYCDLSTQFESARDLFRYIVDGLVDRLDDDDVRGIVEQERQDRQIDPNAEYDRHVRLALKHTSSCRVIIVLDEIDSLVGRDYSDRILAQIRSMYFARANHSVYDRLTYVLSGVAEPTDLIKDKNISPFNIGEKIYLSDFSLSEVRHLLSNARLSFLPEVVEAIFGWASGNPRMTWDICSALEDVQLSGEVITPAIVDSVVERLYLIRHDRPPIDHIRALAETDRQIRSALMSLLYGRGNTLDDSARSRLYLAGITSASATEAPRLKNRIIEMALSEAWLTQIEAQLNGVTKTAASFYRDGNYEQAISLYRQFVDQSGSIDALDEIQAFELAMSQYKLSRVSEAKASFEAVIEKTKSKDFRNTVKFHLASAHMLSGEAGKAIPLLEEVVRFNGNFRIQAKHAISSSYLSIAVEENVDRIKELSGEVLIESDAEHDLSETDIAALKAASHYNLAQAHLVEGDNDAAQTSLRAAIASIDREHLPGLVAVIIRDFPNVNDRAPLLESAVDVLSAQKPALSIAPTAFEFKAEDLARLLDVAADDKQHMAFRRLVDFGVAVGEGSRFNRLLRLARSGSKRSPAAVSALIRLAFEDENCLASETASDRTDAARLWLATVDQSSLRLSLSRFITEIDEKSDLLVEADILIMMKGMATLLQLGRDDEAMQLADFVRRHDVFFVERTRSLFALYVQHEMALFNSIGDTEREKVAAKEILQLTTPRNIRDLGLSGRSESLMSRIRAQAQDALRAKTQPLSDIGRNDFVIVRDRATGLQSSAKFKKVSERLLSGSLEFVSTLKKNP